MVVWVLIVRFLMEQEEMIRVYQWNINHHDHL